MNDLNVASHVRCGYDTHTIRRVDIQQKEINNTFVTSIRRDAEYRYGVSYLGNPIFLTKPATGAIPYIISLVDRTSSEKKLAARNFCRMTTKVFLGLL